jgi:hypothetical protein
VTYIFPARLLDMFDERGGNVHRIAFRADFVCEQAREEASARADVAYCHAGFELAGGNDVVTLGVNFPALDLEFSDELGYIGTAIRNRAAYTLFTAPVEASLVGLSEKGQTLEPADLNPLQAASERRKERVNYRG